MVGMVRNLRRDTTMTYSNDNNAKQIVIDEAVCLAAKLQNGDAGCVETQGRAIAHIVKMLTPLYQADFVTTEKCKKIHQVMNNRKTTRIKIGPIEIEGPLATTVLVNCAPLLCCGIMLYMVGKVQNWW